MSIRVGAALGTDDHGQVDLLVDDDGPGVAGGDTARIFEKFRRGRRSGDRARGLGIGLSVARGMTEAMGGSIEAEPSPMGGLRIRMRLRVAVMEPREVAADGPGLAGEP